MMDWNLPNHSGPSGGQPWQTRLGVVAALMLLHAGMVSGQDRPTNNPAGTTNAVSNPTNGVAAIAAGGARPDPGTNSPAKSNPPGTIATPGATNDYRSFQVIADRNILEAEKPKPPRIDVISLSGTIISPRGEIAFFDSSASDFRKAVRMGDQIAGYTLREVQQTQIALEGKKESIQLKVGEQLRREDDGDWRVTRGESFTSSSGESSGDNSGSARSSTAATSTSESRSDSSNDSGGGGSDALKRLLEKRRKEQSP